MTEPSSLCAIGAGGSSVRVAAAARRWEPRRLRFRLFATAGRIVRGGRRLTLRLTARSPWAALITASLARLNSLAPG